MVIFECIVDAPIIFLETGPWPYGLLVCDAMFLTHISSRPHQVQWQGRALPSLFPSLLALPAAAKRRQGSVTRCGAFQQQWRAETRQSLGTLGTEQRTRNKKIKMGSRQGSQSRTNEQTQLGGEDLGGGVSFFLSLFRERNIAKKMSLP